MADLASPPSVQIEYFDVRYTMHLSNGETKTIMVKTYPCPRCNTPMLVGPISRTVVEDEIIASYSCPIDGYTNVQIEEKE